MTTSIIGTVVLMPTISATRRTVSPGGILISNASASSLGAHWLGWFISNGWRDLPAGEPNLVFVPLMGAGGGRGTDVPGETGVGLPDGTTLGPLCQGVGFHCAGTMNGSFHAVASLLSITVAVTNSGLKRLRLSSAKGWLLSRILRI